MDGNHLDLSGLACPLPVLRANKEIRRMDPGGELTCIVTDPAAPEDFANFCESAGHELLSCDEAAGSWTITVRKGG